MSDLVIQRTVKVGNVPTDATSVKLSDAAGVYGIKRDDTGAILVAAGTAMGKVSTGVYRYTLEDAVAGVTYRYGVEVVLNGQTYRFERTAVAPVDVAEGNAYLLVAAADAIAATLPGLASFKAASAEAKAAALLQASDDIDAGLRYQGRKYDPDGTITGTVQVREFPRVPYEGSGFGWDVAGLAQPGSEVLTAGVPTAGVWDWDADTSTAIVPSRVLQAVVHQADSIIAGTLAASLDAQHAGLAGQTVGPVSETYVRDGGAASNAASSGLCRRAMQLMERYRIRQGKML